MKTIADIRPPRVVYDKPAADYAERLERLARRSVISERVANEKYSSGTDSAGGKTVRQHG